MTPTITITEEAREFLERVNDPALRELVDQASKEYSEFMGGLPVMLDAFGEDGADRIQVDVAVVAEPEQGSMMDRLTAFGRVWRASHTRDEWRAVGFSVHYV